MDVERWLRLIAGSFVLISLALGWFYSPWYYLLTVFVAVNLIQSAFSSWCPMMSILRKSGVRDTASIRRAA